MKAIPGCKFVGKVLYLVTSLSICSTVWQQALAAGEPVHISEIDRKKAAVLYNEGVDLYQSHQLKPALEKFKQSIKLNPNFAEAHCNYGGALLQTGEYTTALAELRGATELKPELPTAWADLGTCYQSLGETQKAIDAYERYLSLEPNGAHSAQVRGLLAVLKNELKRSSTNSIKDGPNDYLGDATANGITRWAENRMPLKIYIKSGTGVPSYRPDFETTLKNAFQEWQASSDSHVSFTYTDNERDADIVCSWTNDPKQMISSAEGGHAVVIPDGPNIARAKIILLTVDPSGSGTVTDNFAHRVALHEIGHSLGLLEHSRNPQDILFGSVPPGDMACNLSERDKNTLVALYTLNQATLAAHPLDVSKLLMNGDPSTTAMRVIKLNVEASEAMKNKDFAMAVQKLEEAHKLDANNDLISTNLGSAYGNCGTIACMMGNYSAADQYFHRALPLLEKGSNKANYILVLKNYLMLLKLTHHTADADKVAKQIDAIQQPK